MHGGRSDERLRFRDRPMACGGNVIREQPAIIDLRTDTYGT
jgi:hypothetical protein